MPANLKGALLGLTGMGLFAACDATIKALGGGYSPFQVIFFSGIMSIPLIAGMALMDRGGGSLRPLRPWVMALRCVIFVLNSLCATYAFTALPLAQCYAIFFTMPIFITLLAALLLGERIDVVRGMAMLMGLVGVVVALDPQGSTLQWAHLVAMGGAVFGATNYVLIRGWGGAERTVVMILYPAILQLAVATIALPLVFVPMPAFDVGLTGLMALLAFGGYIATITAYRHAPGIVVAPMQYSQILWGALLGALLFGEVMSGRTILGTALIVAAGLVIVMRRDKAA